MDLPTLDTGIDPSFVTAMVDLYPRILQQAIKLVGSAADAQDLVHDTIERALRRQSQFRFGDHPDRWIRTIMTHLFLDQRRRARPMVEFDESVGGVAAGADVGDEAEWQDVAPATLESAIERLAPPLRAVVALRMDEEDSSYQTIGKKLGIPPNTVGTRLRRARLQLRKHLSDAALAPDFARAA